MASSNNVIRVPIARPLWAKPTHPIFWLETRRQARGKGLGILRPTYIPFLIVCITGSFWLWLLPVFLAGGYYYSLESVLSFSAITLFAIQFITGAIGAISVVTQTAPIISSETELQSWQLVRTTSLALAEIVFGKLAATLVRLRTILVGQLLLRIPIVVNGLLIVASSMASQISYSRPSDNNNAAVSEWLPVLMPALVLAVLFLAQPVVQFLLNGAIGLAASVFARSRAQAISTALTLRLSLWIFAALGNVAAMWGVSRFLSSQFTTLYMQSSSSDQRLWTISLTITSYIVFVFASQLGMAFVLLGLALRRARQLGV